ncbi:hypothetical protein WDW89_14705 [Deltaproteobacteria bacterium TL4]
MALWSKVAVEFLQQLEKEDHQLAKIIFASVKRLENKPSLGQYAPNTRYYYTDSDYGFTIGYNFHPESKLRELEVVYILRKEIPLKKTRDKSNNLIP